MSLNANYLTAAIVSKIATEQKITIKQTESTIKLLLDDCTIPFIARYRKEATEGLDEVQIRDVRDRFEYLVALEERKETVLRSIEEQGKLTETIKNKIVSCATKTELEDLYLPFKPKKRTRGQIAKEKGLEPLANTILNEPNKIVVLAEFAKQFINEELGVKTVEDCLKGANDIISEIISETPEVRGEIREFTFNNAMFISDVKEEFKDKKTKFSDYYSFSEAVATIAPHRLMALRRGEKEGILRLTLDISADEANSIISSYFIKDATNEEITAFMRKAIDDSYNRLIAPSIETELRLETKNSAEEEAVKVFAKNLRNLLLLPPIPKKIVLGIDPGIRTGSKLVVVDKTGKLVQYTTIFPDLNVAPDAPKNSQSREKLLDIIKTYKIEFVAIGNGTAGREIEIFVSKTLEDVKRNDIKVAIVNESGASVYSASDVAREEFPDLDLTYRGAVSIARRLQDPLAELVKIDPKSIGVGQYQHDINQTFLKKTLGETVESCVNYVGVNLNTASPSLLSYVSGIGPSLAKNIVTFRNMEGEYISRAALKKVPGFGPKTFEQAAGFLRIPESENPLDNSAVHPERYIVVENIAKKLGVTIKELVGDKTLLNSINIKDFITEEVGELTLKDILAELAKPGRDPRENGTQQTYNKNIVNFDDLKEGQVVSGTVTNVTHFGAFVDIGVHQDGLIHISEISHEFITNPVDAISVGQVVQVKIIEIDRERKRIGLSKKAVEEPPKNSQPQQNNKQVTTNAVKKDNSRVEFRTPKLKSDNNSKPYNNTTRTVTAKPSNSDRFSTKKETENKPEAPATINDLLNKFGGKRISK